MTMTLIRSKDWLNIIDKRFTVDMNIDADKNFITTSGKEVQYYTCFDLNIVLTAKHWSYEENSLLIIHMNARSMNKNIDDIQLLLNNLEIKFTVI